MKKILVVIVVFVCCLSSFNMNAQQGSKFGHIDYQALILSMPEYDSVMKVVETYYENIQKQGLAMKKELEDKSAAYDKEKDGLTDFVREVKEKEINDLYTRLQEFANSMQTKVEAKQSELLSPILEKANTAIKEVAKEKGYTYIFNNMPELLLYSEPADDVMPSVKKKLGIE
jgi:outer membrane protein